MTVLSVAESGFVSLWPYAQLGHDAAIALYAAGCRKDKPPTKVTGYALRMSTPAPVGARKETRMLKSRWLVNARVEAMYIARGRDFELFRAVGRGAVTVWEHIESVIDVNDDAGLLSDVAKIVRLDGQLIEKATNPRNSKELAAFATNLARTVTRDLSRVVRQPIKEYIEAMMGQFPGRDFADLTTSELDQLWEAGRAVLTPGLQTGYGLAAEQITQNIQLSIVDIADGNREFLRRNIMPRIANSFRTEDVEAIEQIGTQSGFWIRDSAGNISQSMDGKARKIIQTGLARGQGRDEIAQILTEELPQMWQKYGFNYARVVAANAVSRARSYSEVASYQSVGIEYLELMAMLDERTTDICRVLDGTIIEVNQAMAHQRAIAAIQNPEEIKNVAPFLSERKNQKTGNVDVRIGKSKFATVSRSGVGNVDDRGDFKRHMGTKKMVSKGVTMPPFHHNCRTMTVARVEMVQVPSGYDPKAGAIGATNDEKQPSGNAVTKPKKQPQQRPLAFEKTPKAGKPTSSGQQAKYDPPINRKPGALPKKTAQKPVSSKPNDVSGFNSLASSELEKKHKKPVRITGATFDQKNNVIKYRYKNPDNPKVDGVWYVVTNEKDAKKIADQFNVKPGTVPRGNPKRPAALKPKKHPIAQMGKSNIDAKTAMVTVDRATDAAMRKPKSYWKNVHGRVAKGMDGDERFVAFSKRTGVSADDFSKNLRDKFMITARDTSDEMHYFQLAVKEEFGLSNKTLSVLDDAVIAKLKRSKHFDETLGAYRAFARAQYNETQKMLKRSRKADVSLFRGARFKARGNNGIPKNSKFDGRLSDALITTQPVNSYTLDSDIAYSFARGEQYSAVIKQKVPAERVLGSFETGLGSDYEAEYLIIGGEDDWAQAVTWNSKSDPFADVANFDRELFGED